MPILEVLRDLWVDFSFCVEEVESFVDVYDDVEEGLDSFARAEDGRYHRDAEQFAQFGVVEVVPSALDLVEHVEGADHSEVHVDELCGEVEVPFEVACVDDVQDDVWRLLEELFADVDFLGAVGC